MAVNARHAQLAGVKLVRERHRLLRRIADSRELRSQGTVRRRAQQADDKHANDETLPKASIGPRLKDHGSSCLLSRVHLGTLVMFSGWTSVVGSMCCIGNSL